MMHHDVQNHCRCNNNEIIIGNTDNIVVEFIHHNDVNNHLVIIIFDITHGFKCDARVEPVSFDLFCF